MIPSLDLNTIKESLVRICFDYTITCVEMGKSIQVYIVAVVIISTPFK